MNFSISDVMIDAGDMTDANFLSLMDIVGPAGNTAFKPFLPGDHQYKNAMFKEVFETEVNDRPRIGNLTVSVDVPDVIDRGNLQFTGSKTWVAFKRVFTTPPEVLLSLKQAPNKIVDLHLVGAPTKAGFYVEAKDSANAIVTVTIGWIAHGF